VTIKRGSAVLVMRLLKSNLERVSTVTAQRPEGPFRVGRSRTGLGLFATDTIEKGAFIIEYVGPRLSNEEADERRSARYLFEVNSRWTIDGSPYWNTARYLNHSCRPNAEAYETRGRIRFRAKQRIRAGDEITFHYGRDYFERLIKPLGCKCLRCDPGEVR
jgi:SET domain-containing protein